MQLSRRGFFLSSYHFASSAAPSSQKSKTKYPITPTASVPQQSSGLQLLLRKCFCHRFTHKPFKFVSCVDAPPFFFSMCTRCNAFTCACVMPCGHFFPWRIPNIAGFYLARFFQIFSLTYFCNSFLVHSLIAYYSVVNPFLFYKMANLLLAFNSEFAIISAKALK